MCSLSMQFSLLQSPPSRPCPSFLANHEPKLSTTSSSVTFPLKTNTWKCSGTGNLLVLRVKAYGSSSDSSADSSTPPNGTRQPKSRRDILLEYVQNVKPEFMEMFVKRAPKHVVEAMRQTVTNMIGTLPPQFFAVTVTSVSALCKRYVFNKLCTVFVTWIYLLN
jgi:hypothetical protein